MSAILRTMKRPSSSSSLGVADNRKPRGLTLFISTIHQCTLQSQEQAKVQLELAHIRAKFELPNLSSYEMKKYVWKLVYIKLLGYSVDFGNKQVLDLLWSPGSYQEKMVGYLAYSVLLQGQGRDDDDEASLLECIKVDLKSEINMTQCLALHSIANLLPRNSRELAKEVWALVCLAADVNVRKKAVLVLLSLLRAFPSSTGDDDGFPSELQVAELVGDQSPSLAISACALLKHLIVANQTKNMVSVRENRPKVQAMLCQALRPLVVDFNCPEGYYYHGVAAPFLQVAILQCLLAMKRPPAAAAVAEQLLECLHKIISNVKWSKSTAVNNASRCVAFEALQLIIEYNSAADALAEKSNELLMLFLLSRNSNTRYLALNTLANVARVACNNPEYANSPWLLTLDKCQSALVANLQSPDLSVRRKALDLLFHSCRAATVDQVLQELVECLDKPTPAEFKQEVVLRVAVLAEKFTTSLEWYLGVAVCLLNRCEEECAPEDLWYRIVHMVSSASGEEQRLAALQMYRALLAPGSRHSSVMVRVAVWVMGEFGYKLTEYSNLKCGELDHDVLPIDLFGACHRHFLLDTDNRTRGKTRMVLLTAYAKLASIYPNELHLPAAEVFRSQLRQTDSELAQRANEYLAVFEISDSARLFDPMPVWPKPESKLHSQLMRLANGGGSTSPRATQVLTPVVVIKPPSKPAPVAVAVAAKTAHTKQFWDALLMNKALLFEDGLVQLGTTHEFEHNTGRIDLFLGNLSSTVSLPACRVQLDQQTASGNLDIQGDVDFTVDIPPGGQIKVSFTLTCLGAMLGDPPRVIVSQSHGVLASVYLPVVMTSFLEPFPIVDLGAFNERWARLGKLTVQCSRTTCPLQTHVLDSRWPTCVQRTRTLLQLLPCSLVPLSSTSEDHDDDDDVEFLGCARWLASVGVLLKLELDSAATEARIEVRATKEVVANALLPVLAAQVQRLFA
ncbi:hypothetical protein BASA81_003790 [Batrachochytrium salamandrivorans]|nr:hypothetical protein BASA81_003790 [Batrachochytrium salamandrivorans]